MLSSLTRVTYSNLFCRNGGVEWKQKEGRCPCKGRLLREERARVRHIGPIPKRESRSLSRMLGPDSTGTVTKGNRCFYPSSSPTRLDRVSII